MWPIELQCERSPQGLAEIETIGEPVKNDSDVGPYVINCGRSAYAIGFLKVSFNVDEMLNVFYANGHLTTNMRKIPRICSPDAAFFFGKRKLIWLAFFLGTHASAYDRLTLHFWLRTSLWLQFKPHQIAAGVAYLAVLWT
ncbi:hypothetical protein Tco_0549381 [Tanacetum coccineum]